MGRLTTFIRVGRTREQEGQIKATVAACSRAGVTGHKMRKCVDVWLDGSAGGESRVEL